MPIFKNGVKVSLYNKGGAYKPINFYKGSQKVTGWKPFSLVGVTSATIENTYEDKAEIVAYGKSANTYPNITLVVRNVDSSKEQNVLLPMLLKIPNGVADVYNINTGVLNKKVSDWVLLTGDKNWACMLAANNRKNFYCVALESPNYQDVAASICYSFTSMQIFRNYYSSPIFEGYICGSTGSKSNLVYISVPNTITGMGDYTIPSQSEVKAFFYGWQMCNADGTTPYYASITPYNQSTWAEWSFYVPLNAIVTKDNTGVSLTGNGSNVPTMTYNTTIKGATKYLFLYTVVENTLSNNTFGFANEFAWATIPLDIGNNKAIRTSRTASDIDLVLYSHVNTTGTIKIKDFRMYELPAGSQIETDANTKTANELNTLYPFMGQCIKHWKKLTEGTGITSILPTASYAGFMSYRLLHELHETKQINVEAVPLQTYYPTTVLETINEEESPLLNINVKVKDL